MSGDDQQLLQAARGGRLDEVMALLEAGASVDSANAVGITPLVTSAMRGHAEVVRVLLKAGADPNAIDANGSSVLTHAAASSDARVIELLVAAGADVNYLSPDGRTPLLNAVWSFHSSPAVVTGLLRAGADPGARDPNERLTAREWAVRDGREDLARLFGERSD